MAGRAKPARSLAGSSREAFLALVEGRVQGVGFRYTARREALRLGLTGWVRNLDEGSVEVFAEGEPAALSVFEDWLRAGPPGAWVENCRIVPRSPTGCYSDFEIEF